MYLRNEPRMRELHSRLPTLAIVRLPIETLVIILSVEKLNLLESVGARQIAAYRRMNGQERVQRRGAGLLRPDHQESR